MKLSKTLRKTLTWRVIALITTLLISYWITGSYAASLLLALTLNGVKTLLYFWHEVIWEKF